MTFHTGDRYTLTFFTAQSGALSVRLDKADGTSLHLHSLVDPEKEADYFSDLRCWGDRLVLAGSGLGYHLSHILASVRQNTTILLVEYYDELAERTVGSFPEQLRNRVTVITGTTVTWRENVDRFLLGGHYVQIVKHPPSVSAHGDFYRIILKALSRKVPASSVNRSGIIMQGDFFLERELIHAAAENGTNLFPFNYKQHKTTPLYELELQKLLETKRPEMLISVNMLGFDGNGILAEYTQHRGIPVVVWFVDDPRPILLNQQRYLTPNMIACTWEHSYMEFLRKQGFSKVDYLPLATDPHQFCNVAPLIDTVPCGFIGTSMGKSFLDEIALKFLYKEEYCDSVRKIAEKIAVDTMADIDGLIQGESAIFSDLDNANRTWLRSYIIHTASMIKRRKVINRLKTVGVQTFGDADGWKKLCGPEIVTHPDIDYRTEIEGYYRSVTVNINITSCQMPTAVNQRIFDVPVCGSFILTDHQSDLEELFAPNEYVSYRSAEECAEKVSWYLNRSSDRKKVAAAARTHILLEHTYKKRLQKLFRGIL